MKTIITLGLCFALSLTKSLTAIGAAIIIIPSSASGAQCPLVATSYSVRVATGSLPTCTYTWTVSGGSFVNNISTGTLVRVIWSDLPGTGTLTVTASNCNPSGDNGSTITNTYTRLSVAGQPFLLSSDPLSVCTNTINAPICSNAPINLCADKMFIKNTGGAGEPVKREVDRYIWSIPAGWKSLALPILALLMFRLPSTQFHWNQSAQMEER